MSGINSGLNAGINVLYSGTVAAAIEGAFFRIPSVAVSLEYDLHADFKTAAKLATELIEELFRDKKPEAELFNINFPTAATKLYQSGGKPEVHVVPLGFWRYGETYIKRQDPKGKITIGLRMNHHLLLHFKKPISRHWLTDTLR